MFTHLLVPLDGSDLAEAALPTALAIAGRFESEITLLCVARSPVLLTSDVTDVFVSLREEMHQEAAAYIRNQEAALQSQGYKVNGRVSEGDSVADAILDVADELGVDGIVMSTHGRGGVKRWVFGSVADKVLQQAKAPIILIRALPEERISVPPIEDLSAMRSHETANG
jgi:nucleotide-binding universal stress UspA family protein